MAELLLGWHPQGGNNYNTQHMVYSKEVGGVHFVFLSMWPDKTVRPLIDADLAAMMQSAAPSKIDGAASLSHTF